MANLTRRVAELGQGERALLERLLAVQGCDVLDIGYGRDGTVYVLNTYFAPRRAPASTTTCDAGGPNTAWFG